MYKIIKKEHKTTIIITHNIEEAIAFADTVIVLSKRPATIKKIFNMKKVFVVSKTHLDLGFTDYAENIRQKYIDTFIPEAIDLAERVNTDSKKYFIWIR